MNEDNPSIAIGKDADVSIQIGDLVRSYHGVPSPTHVRIVFLPIGGNTSHAAAQELCEAVASELLLLGAPTTPEPAVEVPDSGGEGICLLVVAGDEEGYKSGKDRVRNWLAKGRAEESQVRVLPVCQLRDDISIPFPGKPNRLRSLNVAFWYEEPRELAPSILSEAGVVTSDFRVFISYRRKDTQPLAEQLFGELTKAGFQVFVDRFSVPMGARFQRSLTERLEAMSMVLVLESANFVSPWTNYEVAFAEIRRLGICALSVPLAGPAKEVQTVPNQNRLRLEASDFDSCLLAKQALRRVVDFVKHQHNRAFAFRSQALRLELEAALSSVGLKVQAADPDAPNGVLRPSSKQALQILAVRATGRIRGPLCCNSTRPAEQDIGHDYGCGCAGDRAGCKSTASASLGEGIDGHPPLRRSPDTSAGRGRLAWGDHDMSWEVFLSASIPEIRPGKSPVFFEVSPPDVANHVRTAVAHLASRVFDLGGSLVFGGHPSVTPRILQVASDLGLASRSFDYAPIIVYQSKFFEDALIDEARLLKEESYVQYISTEIRENLNEVVPMNTEDWLRARSAAIELSKLSRKIVGDRPENLVRDASLLEMRFRMLERENLKTMVALGGFDGVLDEASIFLMGGPDREIWPVTTTGGAARIVAQISYRYGVIRPADGPNLTSMAEELRLPDYVACVNQIPRWDSEHPDMTPLAVGYGLVMDLVARRAKATANPY